MGSPLARRAKPGAEIGEVSGSERFIRGNRRANDFVGSDSRDPRTFIGSQQGTTTGTVRSATEDLRAIPDNGGRINRPLRKRRPREMYEPQLEVAFRVVSRSTETIETSLVRHLHSVEVRFGSIQATVIDRTVTLRGTVGTDHDKRLAELLVLFEPGIADVRNALIVLRAIICPPIAPWMAILNCWRGMVSFRRSQ